MVLALVPLFVRLSVLPGTWVLPSVASLELLIFVTTLLPGSVLTSTGETPVPSTHGESQTGFL
jgi:hypothetical protein